MATDIKIFRVSVNFNQPSADPNNPVNLPSNTYDDLRLAVLSEISASGGSPDLSGGFRIVHVQPLAGNASKVTYEVWVEDA